MKVSQSGNNSIQNSETGSAKRGTYAANSQEAKRTDRGEKTEKADESAKSSSSPGAKAEISAKSREFSQAKAIATQTPDIREDRVADLKKRISEGTYKINEDEIADRMVDEHIKGPSIK